MLASSIKRKFAVALTVKENNQSFGRETRLLATVSAQDSVLRRLCPSRDLNTDVLSVC